MAYFSDLDVERQEQGFTVVLDMSQLDLDGVAEVAVARAMGTLQHKGISIAQRVVELGSTLNKPMYSRPRVERDDASQVVTVDWRRVRPRTAAIAAKFLRLAKEYELGEGD